jgi:hypothetical protein
VRALAGRNLFKTAPSLSKTLLRHRRYVKHKEYLQARGSPRFHHSIVWSQTFIINPVRKTRSHGEQTIHGALVLWKGIRHETVDDASTTPSRVRQAVSVVRWPMSIPTRAAIQCLGAANGSLKPSQHEPRGANSHALGTRLWPLLVAVGNTRDLLPKNPPASRHHSRCMNIELFKYRINNP